MGTVDIARRKEMRRRKKNAKNGSRTREKDIVRLESEAAKLKQKQRLIESESEIEIEERRGSARNETRCEKKRKGARELEKLRKEVEDAKETLENEQLSHERFVQSMLSDATYWTSEVERRNEKREKDVESERKAVEETLERTDAKATRLEEAKDALRKELERRDARMKMNARIKERVSAQIVIARCFERIGKENERANFSKI